MSEQDTKQEPKTEQGGYLAELWKAFLSPAGSVAILAGFLSFAGNQAFEHWKSNNDENRKLVLEQVSTFMDSTKQFDALAATLANTVMDGEKPSADLKQQIYTNLTNQSAELDQLDPLLKSLQSAKSYRDALQSYNANISKISSPKDLRDFWLMLSNVLTYRKILTSELRRKADLELEARS